MLENLKAPVYITNCKVRTVAAQLDEKDKKIFLDAIADEQNWAAVALQKALHHEGIKIGQEVIRRHRSGVCSCSKI